MSFRIEDYRRRMLESEAGTPRAQRVPREGFVAFGDSVMGDGVNVQTTLGGGRDGIHKSENFLCHHKSKWPLID